MDLCSAKPLDNPQGCMGYINNIAKFHGFNRETVFKMSPLQRQLLEDIRKSTKDYTNGQCRCDLKEYFDRIATALYERMAA